jgi:glycosyltransferase involved in cell wall biosynthesis
MLWLLGRAASHVWLSTEAWRPFVSPYVRRGTPIDWLPIPAPVEPEAPLAPPSTRAGGIDRAPTVGHFSTFSPVVTRHLAPALVQVLERAPDATALLIGRDSDRFCRSFVAAHPQFSPRVRATGTLSSDRVAAQLLACDVMLMPFPDGVTARNTSLLSSLACGRPVVTNSGPLTEPFWRSDDAVLLAESPEAHALATLVITALDRPAVRDDLGARAAAFYERRCSRRAAIDTLMPASASAPGASASLDHVRRSQTAAAAKTV